MAAVPVTVNEAEPFVPVVKFKPVVDASVIVPCKTDSVREFEPLPAAGLLKPMALPLLVEKTSDPFWSSVPEGGATIAGALSAVTVKTTVVAADSLSPRSESERNKESDVGLSVTPLRAAFRLAAVPDTVNDAGPVVSVVKLTPGVDANVSIPWATDRVSESVLTPAAALVKLTAMLLPVAGAVIARGLAALTVSATLLEFESLSVGSETKTPSESAPV